LIEQTAGQFAQQGMEVKKWVSPVLVRSGRETSRPGAVPRLRRNLALRALATAEAIEVAEAEIEARIREVSRDLGDRSQVDPARLRAAVGDDLLREALLQWLEENSTLSEKAPPSADAEAAESRATDDSEPAGPGKPAKAKSSSAADKDKTEEKGKARAGDEPAASDTAPEG
ncbi:MAG: trigger factor, partial [Cyanobium sp.]